MKFSFPSLSESRLSNKTFWAGAAWSYFLVGRQYFYFKIIWETFQKTCCRPRWNSSSKKMSPYIVQNLRKSYFVQNLRKSYIGRNIGKEWFNDRHLLVGLWGNTLLHSPPGYNSVVNLSFNLPIKTICRVCKIKSDNSLFIISCHSDLESPPVLQQYEIAFTLWVIECLIKFGILCFEHFTSHGPNFWVLFVPAPYSTWSPEIRGSKFQVTLI